ncbi:MAG: diacylglycerol kinase [Gallionella sp.]|nr:diacylglycerol kinase [Gallionella sp.]
MSSPYKNPTGWVHVLYGIRHGMAGLRAAWQYEDAFRQEIFVACCALPIVYFCTVSLVGKVVMVASLFLVLIVELLNSAVEAAVDHTSLARHRLAKRAKDIASAAVLLSIVNAVVVWVMLLYGT